MPLWGPVNMLIGSVALVGMWIKVSLFCDAWLLVVLGIEVVVAELSTTSKKIQC